MSGGGSVSSAPDSLKLTRGLSRQSLSEQLAEAILEVFLDRRLKPGDALPSTAKLAAEYGVSRTVVREALADLMGRGVIARVLSREPVVALPGPDHLRELLRIRIIQDSITIDSLVELRLPLEAQAARLAAARRTPEQMERIQGVLDVLASVDHEAEFHEADIQLHREIALASGNLLMSLVLDSLTGLLHDFRRAWYRAQRAEGNLPALVEEHRRVVDAIRAGDPEAAATAMSDHLLTGLEKIRRGGDLEA